MGEKLHCELIQGVSVVELCADFMVNWDGLTMSCANFYGCISKEECHDANVGLRKGSVGLKVMWTELVEINLASQRKKVWLQIKLIKRKGST
jgi:hypothetical protein